MTDHPTHDQLQHRPDRWYHYTTRQRDSLLAIATHTRLEERPTAAAIQSWLAPRYGTSLDRPTVETTLQELATAGLLVRDRQPTHSTAYRLTDPARTTLASHGRFIDALDLQTLPND